jgi:hypothetical protein
MAGMLTDDEQFQATTFHVIDLVICAARCLTSRVWSTYPRVIQDSTRP